MNPIRRVRLVAPAQAGLACAWLGIVVAAPASVSVPPPRDGRRASRGAGDHIVDPT
jgi:hypothetical protein